MGCTEIDSGPDLSHGLQACHRLLQTVPLKEKRKHDFIHSIVDRHLGVNVVCSSHTGVILVLLTFPTPACKLLFLCLSLGQGLLESSPRHYLLDQSQPGCEKGGLLNGETVAGKGGGRASYPWAPRVCLGASSWPRMWDGRARGPRHSAKTGSSTSRALKKEMWQGHEISAQDLPAESIWRVSDSASTQPRTPAPGGRGKAGTPAPSPTGTQDPISPPPPPALEV